MTDKRVPGILLFALPLLLAGLACGGSTEKISARCIEVPDTLMDDIESGLTVLGGGSLGLGWAVKSDDFSNLYFVAADIEGPGMDGEQIGLWALNRLDGTGLIYSVNALALEFSEWADGPRTDAEMSPSDDGAAEAIECARRVMP